jgi:Fe-S cluster assembly scaffold protein SufB
MRLQNPTGQKTITLEENESLEIYLEDFEKGSRSFTLEIILKGPQAQCHITGRAQVHDQDQKNWIIKQNFQGTDQIGTIDLRGTAEDRGRLEFDGSAILEKNSQNATANITEKIRLFDEAQGFSLPILTVETDQVKQASHAASVAPIDPETLLYCQSRGIESKEAQQLLKQGFLALK